MIVFAECPLRGTRQTITAVTGNGRGGRVRRTREAVCRVLPAWHSAKPIFAECRLFAERLLVGTRQSVTLPSARYLALGKRRVSGSEGSEARAPRLGQCRWRPEGRRYPERSLKERLRYVPDSALVVNDITPAPTTMDTTAAGTGPNTHVNPH